MAPTAPVALARQGGFGAISVFTMEAVGTRPFALPSVQSGSDPADRHQRERDEEHEPLDEGHSELRCINIHEEHQCREKEPQARAGILQAPRRCTASSRALHIAPYIVFLYGAVSPSCRLLALLHPRTVQRAEIRRERGPKDASAKQCEYSRRTGRW